MKKILIYTVNDGHFVDSLYHSLGHGFNDIERDVIFYDVNSNNDELSIKRIFDNNDIDFSIGHNEIGINLTNKYDWLGCVYENIEHISVLDDAPYNVVTFNVRNVICKNLIIAYRDRSHVGYLRSIKMKSTPKSVFFMPFGALVEDELDNNIEKDIDIIFSGMYYGQPYREWNDINICNTEKKILNEIADILESNALTVDQAFMLTLKKYKIIDKNTLMYFYRYYTMVYSYIKTYRRDLLVGYLSNTDINFTVCDKSWKKSPYSNKLNFYLASSTKDVLAVYKRSKRLIQDMAEFNNGSHCRIADGFLCNTMVISEHSDYVNEFLDSSKMIQFDWCDLGTLPIIIKKFLHNDSARSSYIANARNVIDNFFLPRHRASKIISIIDRVRKNNKHDSD